MDRLTEKAFEGMLFTLKSQTDTISSITDSVTSINRNIQKIAEAHARLEKLIKEFIEEEN